MGSTLIFHAKEETLLKKTINTLVVLRQVAKSTIVVNLNTTQRVYSFVNRVVIIAIVNVIFIVIGVIIYINFA